MNKIALSLFLALQVINVNAQYNLVPNPSFEVFDTCPDFSGQIRYAIPWTNPLVGSTPDYFNACDTTGLHPANVPFNFVCYQNARTGVAMTNIVTAVFPINPALWNYREYIQVELTDSLIAGEDYCLQFYVSPCDSCHYISNNIGIHFSNAAFSDTCPSCPMPLPLVPQFENPVTNNLDNRFGWNEITGTYTAMGGEKFIIIGNFHDTASTVVTYTGWSNPLSIKFDVATYFIDDVLLSPCDSLSAFETHYMELPIKLFPAPTSEELNILSSEKINSIYLFSVEGKMVYSKVIDKKTLKINVSQLSKGVYIVQIITENKIFNQKFIKN